MAFERPVGAACDTAELEYVAALVQTSHDDMSAFLDASIEAKDIKHYLMSRYGIRISSDQVRATILDGLGGGDEEDACIDIVELVAALIIPALRGHFVETTPGHRSSGAGEGEGFSDEFQVNEIAPDDDTNDANTKSSSAKLPDSMLRDMLDLILVQATGSSEPPKITSELIRSIFASFDETEIAVDDDLVSEIALAASGVDPDAVLDYEAFRRALTDDIRLYDPAVETRLSTHFDDALGCDYENEKGLKAVGMASVNKTMNAARNLMPNDDGSPLVDDEGSKGDDGAQEEKNVGTVRRTFTFPQIDLTAETFRSRNQVVLIWASILLGYLMFFLNEERVVEVCDSDTFGCAVGQGIFNWTIIFLTLSILGTVFVIILSFGNDAYRDSWIDALIGLVGVGVLFVGPFVLDIDGTLFCTSATVDCNTGFPRSPDEKNIYMVGYSMYLAFGCMIAICQVVNGARFFVSKERIMNNKVLSKLLSGSNTRDECMTKQATTYKVNRMLRNAYKLHRSTDRKVSLTGGGKRSLTESSQSLALIEYTKEDHKTELYGGFLWGWRAFWSGRLRREEGVWIHSRLIAGNVAQVFLLFWIFVIGVYVGKGYVEAFYPTPPDCSASFSMNDCYFPADSNDTYWGYGACSNVLFDGTECSDSFETTFFGFDLNDIEIIQPLCQRLDANMTSCPSFTIYSAWKQVKAVVDNDEKCEVSVSYCYFGEDVAPVAGRWIDMPESTPPATCIVGLSDALIPYQFDETCSGVAADIQADKSQVFQDLEDSLNGAKPEKWMIQLSFAVGILVAMMAGCFLAVTYIPSTISTVLQFRSGVIPSLRDKKFVKYRGTLEDVTFLLGTIFWGVLFTAAACVFIFAGVTFLAVWQVTRPFVIQLIAAIIGISVTLSMKMILIHVLGRVNYASFYRKRPWLGNLAGVALECWHLGLTAGYMLARLAKLMTVAALYVGRVDTPFLAPGVGGSLDKFPIIYRKDLLQADAHRHPYIERLGMLCLMKLRYGDDFVKKAGSIWRLLFVFALMPWLRKYRIAEDADVPEEFLMQRLIDGDSSGQKEEIKTLKEKVALLQEEIENLKKAKVE